MYYLYNNKEPLCYFKIATKKRKLSEFNSKVKNIIQA